MDLASRRAPRLIPSAFAGAHARTRRSCPRLVSSHIARLLVPVVLWLCLSRAHAWITVSGSRNLTIQEDTFVGYWDGADTRSLYVTGDVVVGRGSSGNVNVRGNIAVAGSVSLSTIVANAGAAAVSLNADVTVSGRLTAQSGTFGVLSVNGSTVSSTSGPLTLQSADQVVIRSAPTIGNITLSAGSSVVVQSPLVVTAETSLMAHATFGGTASFAGLVSLNGGATVAGTWTVSGNLGAGSATFAGLVNATAGITAYGATTLFGPLSGSSATFSSPVVFNAGVSILTGATVSGQVNTTSGINVGGPGAAPLFSVDAAGNTIVRGSLTVDGAFKAGFGSFFDQTQAILNGSHVAGLVVASTYGSLSLQPGNGQLVTTATSLQSSSPSGFSIDNAVSVSFTTSGTINLAAASILAHSPSTFLGSVNASASLTVGGGATLSGPVVAMAGVSATGQVNATQGLNVGGPDTAPLFSVDPAGNTVVRGSLTVDGAFKAGMASFFDESKPLLNATSPQGLSITTMVGSLELKPSSGEVLTTAALLTSTNPAGLKVSNAAGVVVDTNGTAAVSALGAVSVKGASVSVAGPATFSDPANFSSSLTVGGGATLSGPVVAMAGVSATGQVNATQGLNVGGPGTAPLFSVDPAGNTVVRGSLTVDGAFKAGMASFFDESKPLLNATSPQGLSITTMAGSLELKPSSGEVLTTAALLTSTNPAGLKVSNAAGVVVDTNGTAAVSALGAVSVKGASVSVAGPATFSDPANFSSSLTVGGGATLSGPVVAMAGVSATGQVNATQGLNVGGPGAAPLFSVDPAGNTVVRGSLTVDGAFKAGMASFFDESKPLLNATSPQGLSITTMAGSLELKPSSGEVLTTAALLTSTNPAGLKVSNAAGVVVDTNGTAAVSALGAVSVKGASVSVAGPATFSDPANFSSSLTVGGGATLSGPVVAMAGVSATGQVNATQGLNVGGPGAAPLFSVDPAGNTVVRGSLTVDGAFKAGMASFFDESKPLLNATSPQGLSITTMAGSLELKPSSGEVLTTAALLTSTNPAGLKVSNAAGVVVDTNGTAAVSALGAVSVKGASVSVAGPATFSDPANFSSSLTVGGSATLSGPVVAMVGVSATGQVNATQGLNVGGPGAAPLFSVDPAGNTVVRGSLIVDGAFKAGMASFFDESKPLLNATSPQGLSITTMAGSLELKPSSGEVLTTAALLTSTNPAGLKVSNAAGVVVDTNGTAAVSALGAVSVKGASVSVAGPATFSDPANFSSSLTVGGGATLSGPVVAMAGVSATGQVNATQGLNVGGPSTAPLFSVDPAGNAAVGGTLSVKGGFVGAMSFTDALVAPGVKAPANLDINAPNGSVSLASSSSSGSPNAVTIVGGTIHLVGDVSVSRLSSGGGGSFTGEVNTTTGINVGGPGAAPLFSVDPAGNTVVRGSLIVDGAFKAGMASFFDESKPLLNATSPQGLSITTMAGSLELKPSSGEVLTTAALLTSTNPAGLKVSNAAGVVVDTNGTAAVSALGAVSVKGASVSVAGPATFSDPANFSSSLTVGGGATLSGPVVAMAGVSATGQVNATQGLNVGGPGAAPLFSVDPAGNTVVRGSLIVDGAFKAGMASFFDESKPLLNATSPQGLSITTMAGSLELKPSSGEVLTTAALLTSTNPAGLKVSNAAGVVVDTNGTAAVSALGAVSVKGASVSVAGPATFSDPANFSSSLTVGGGATLSGPVVAMAGVSATGQVNATQGLNVGRPGAAPLFSVDPAGNAAVGGTLSVKGGFVGAMSFTDALVAPGVKAPANLDINAPNGSVSLASSSSSGSPNAVTIVGGTIHLVGDVSVSRLSSGGGGSFTGEVNTTTGINVGGPGAAPLFSVDPAGNTVVRGSLIVDGAFKAGMASFFDESKPLLNATSPQGLSITTMAGSLELKPSSGEVLTTAALLTSTNPAGLKVSNAAGVVVDTNGTAAVSALGAVSVKGASVSVAGPATFSDPANFSAGVTILGGSTFAGHLAVMADVSATGQVNATQGLNVGGPGAAPVFSVDAMGKVSAASVSVAADMMVSSIVTSSVKSSATSNLALSAPNGSVSLSSAASALPSSVSISSSSINLNGAVYLASLSASTSGFFAGEVNTTTGINVGGPGAAPLFSVDPAGNTVVRGSLIVDGAFKAGMASFFDESKPLLNATSPQGLSITTMAGSLELKPSSGEVLTTAALLTSTNPAGLKVSNAAGVVVDTNGTAAVSALGAVSVKGASVSVAGPATFSDPANFSSSLTVGGGATLSGPVVAMAGVSATGQVNATQGLNVGGPGAAPLFSVDPAGNAAVGGTLSVKGGFVGPMTFSDPVSAPGVKAPSDLALTAPNGSVTVASSPVAAGSSVATISASSVVLSGAVSVNSLSSMGDVATVGYVNASLGLVVGASGAPPAFSVDAGGKTAVSALFSASDVTAQTLVASMLKAPGASNLAMSANGSVSLASSSGANSIVLNGASITLAGAVSASSISSPGAASFGGLVNMSQGLNVGAPGAPPVFSVDPAGNTVVGGSLAVKGGFAGPMSFSDPVVAPGIKAPANLDLNAPNGTISLVTSPSAVATNVVTIAASAIDLLGAVSVNRLNSAGGASFGDTSGKLAIASVVAAGDVMAQAVVAPAVMAPGAANLALSANGSVSLSSSASAAANNIVMASSSITLAGPVSVNSLNSPGEASFGGLVNMSQGLNVGAPGAPPAFSVDAGGNVLANSLALKGGFSGGSVAFADPITAPGLKAPSDLSLSAPNGTVSLASSGSATPAGPSAITLAATAINLVGTVSMSGLDVTGDAAFNGLINTTLGVQVGPPGAPPAFSVDGGGRVAASEVVSTGDIVAPSVKAPAASNLALSAPNGSVSLSSSAPPAGPSSVTIAGSSINLVGAVSAGSLSSSGEASFGGQVNSTQGLNVGAPGAPPVFSVDPSGNTVVGGKLAVSGGFTGPISSSTTISAPGITAPVNLDLFAPTGMISLSSSAPSGMISLTAPSINLAGAAYVNSLSSSGGASFGGQVNMSQGLQVGAPGAPPVFSVDAAGNVLASSLALMNGITGDVTAQSVVSPSVKAPESMDLALSAANGSVSLASASAGGSSAVKITGATIALAGDVSAKSLAVVPPAGPPTFSVDPSGAVSAQLLSVPSVKAAANLAVSAPNGTLSLSAASPSTPAGSSTVTIASSNIALAGAVVANSLRSIGDLSAPRLVAGEVAANGTLSLSASVPSASAGNVTISAALVTLSSNVAVVGGAQIAGALSAGSFSATNISAGGLVANTLKPSAANLALSAPNGQVTISGSAAPPPAGVSAVAIDGDLIALNGDVTADSLTAAGSLTAASAKVASVSIGPAGGSGTDGAISSAGSLSISAGNSSAAPPSPSAGSITISTSGTGVLAVDDLQMKGSRISSTIGHVRFAASASPSTPMGNLIYANPDLAAGSMTINLEACNADSAGALVLIYCEGTGTYTCTVGSQTFTPSPSNDVFTCGCFDKGSGVFSWRCKM
eukprot:tig00000983_g5906.t1